MQIFKDLLGVDHLKCVDVGARGGMPKQWLPFKGLVDLDAIEPDARACKVEADAGRPNERWFPVGLAAKTGEAILYLLKKPSGSSLYPPNPDAMRDFSGESYGDVAAEVPVKVLSFADFLRTFERPLPNLIKLDTQGSELDILKSLDAAQWRDALAVQTEVEFVELYKEQPLFFELHTFMSGLGFVLFDLLPVRQHRYANDVEYHYLRKYLGLARNRRDSSARLIAGDALYLRPPAEVLASGDRIACLKMLLVLLMYRFFDESFWFIEQCQAAGIITPAEQASLTAAVVAEAPRPTLQQRAGPLGDLARAVGKALRLGKNRKYDYWLIRKWDF